MTNMSALVKGVMRGSACAAILALAACADMQSKYDDFAARANKAMNGAVNSSSSTQKNVDVPLYTSLSGVDTFNGLYAGQDTSAARNGNLQFPRAALTFVKYGASLQCWQIRAKIWTSSTASSDQEFQVCDVPYTSRDSLGQGATVSEGSLYYISKYLKTRKNLGKGTGEVRTTGPLPPSEPFNFGLFSSPGGIDAFGERLNHILARLALISGFSVLSDAVVMPAMSFDPRMWFVKFEEGGMVK